MQNQPDDATWNTIANAAYNAYGAVTGFKNFQGQPMPSFDELPQTIKEAWERAARTVGECLQQPQMIAASTLQTGQQLIDEALWQTKESDTGSAYTSERT
jgi:hypothetical protein